MPDPGLTADCLTALAAYRPDDPQQLRLRDDIADHVRTHQAGWSRECPGAHVTASALIASPTADRVLLIHHRKLGRWLQTGGHVEASDVTLAAAALREAREESGLAGLRLVPGILHLDRHEVPCGDVRPTFHLDVRHLVLADAVEGFDRVAGSREVEDARWFPADALPTNEASVTVLVDLARQWLA